MTVWCLNMRLVHSMLPPFQGRVSELLYIGDWPGDADECSRFERKIPQNDSLAMGERPRAAKAAAGKARGACPWGDPLVEQFLPERFALVLPLLAILRMLVAIIALVAVIVIIVEESFAAADDLVEFAAIEPDTAALRADIDFDALPFGDA